MDNWFTYALNHPWAFITLFGAIFLWKTGQKVSAFLGVRVFGENGLIEEFLQGLKSDSQEMKQTITDISENHLNSVENLQTTLHQGLEENKLAIQALKTQLVSAIQARPDNEELFDVLFTNNPMPICFVGQDHTFTRTNNACAEFWGYSAGELAHMTFSDLTDDEDIAADLDNVERVAAGVLDKYRMEKTYITKSRVRVRAALYVFRYPKNGAFLHYISIIIPLNK